MRFNFRGIGQSQGGWDEGRGEVDDALAVLDAVRAPGEALILSGFSFGGYVASRAAQRIAEPAQRLVLVVRFLLTVQMFQEQLILILVPVQLLDVLQASPSNRSTQTHLMYW